VKFSSRAYWYASPELSTSWIHRHDGEVCAPAAKGSNNAAIAIVTRSVSMFPILPGRQLSKRLKAIENVCGREERGKRQAVSTFQTTSSVAGEVIRRN
jgi:hypothetical protein